MGVNTKQAERQSISTAAYTVQTYYNNIAKLNAEQTLHSPGSIVFSLKYILMVKK